MSRLGKKPITILPGVTVSVADSKITAKGPAGALVREFPSVISMTVENNAVLIKPVKDGPEISALWGTWASHVFNMIEGVSKSFEKKLIIEGVGFKADVKGNEIVFAVGFSHPVKVKIPSGLKVVSDKNGISVSGPDIELVGDFAARLRSVKKPEPYKGKGIRYAGEIIRRKQGKKTV